MCDLLISVAVVGWLLSPSAQAGVQSEVYAALLSGAGYHGVQGSQMLVLDEWLPLEPVGDAVRPEWLAKFNGMPAALREAVRRPPSTKRGAVDPGLFPARTRFVSNKAIETAFNGSRENAWAAFTRQHDAAGWVAFSDVIVTSDGLDALVYSEAHCGGLCGEGLYIWLHRTAPGAPWTIMKGVTSWIARADSGLTPTRGGAAGASRRGAYGERA